MDRGNHCKSGGTGNEILRLSGEILNNYTLYKIPDVDKAVILASRILKQIIRNYDAVDKMYLLKRHDYYSFKHSVNVCTLALLMGICVGYDFDKLKQLGLGALLHDIGKIKIPDRILKKPDKLTTDEFNEIKKHTEYGYEIMKKTEGITESTARIAFGHHERYNGSGYPCRLKGEKINIEARIVAIADVFDALTSDRVYRKRMDKHEVMEYIVALAEQHFDKSIVNIFTSFISLYPEGTKVLLNNKETAVVIKKNKETPNKPVVRLLSSQEIVGIPNGFEIDLLTKKDIFVQDYV